MKLLTKSFQQKHWVCTDCTLCVHLNKRSAAFLGTMLNFIGKSMSYYRLYIRNSTN